MIDTGDILLCKGNGWVSRVVEWVGTSRYSHVGIIVRNPRFLCDTMEDGLYLWDSSYGLTPEAEHGEIRFGVQLHRLEEVLKLYPAHSLYIRHLDVDRNETFYRQLTEIHEEVHAKPYDTHLLDWMEAKLNMMVHFPISSWWKHTDRFWCSALVSYIYVRMGWISDVNWSLIAPREYSSVESTGQLIFTCKLEEEEELQTLL